ncbi:hypothetical protein HDU89_004619 [Geranomyces variabilis]|nr:hypothetical protein HDU89_004619 [Geranomyces variabilis]
MVKDGHKLALESLIADLPDATWEDLCKSWIAEEEALPSSDERNGTQARRAERLAYFRRSVSGVDGAWPEFMLSVVASYVTCNSNLNIKRSGYQAKNVFNEVKEKETSESLLKQSLLEHIIQIHETQSGNTTIQSRTTASLVSKLSEAGTRKRSAQYEEVAMATTPPRHPPSVREMSPPAKRRRAVGVNDPFAAESSSDVEDEEYVSDCVALYVMPVLIEPRLSFVPSSQSLPSDEDSGSGDDTACGSESCLRRAFDAAFEARNAKCDTVLESGKSVESLLHALGHHESEKESWILDLDSAWARATLTKEEQSELRQRAAKLDDEKMSWFEETDVLRRCNAQLLELEEMFEADSDARELYLHLAKDRLIRDGEDEVKHRKLFALRRVLMKILNDWWENGDVTTTIEAAVFEKLWNVIFDDIKPKGFVTTAMDESIAASKARKLLTYESTKGVRGLEPDRAWVTKTGHAVVWGEGKRSTWVEDYSMADQARRKAKKGSKDCGDFTLLQTGRLTETYASVWLGADWELFATVSLPSGACLTAEVLKLTMPRAFEGFLQLTHLLRRVLAWTTILEEHGKELARPIVRRQSVGRPLPTVETPKAKGKR